MRSQPLTPNVVYTFRVFQRHSALSEITENLYLSGIGGINAENLQAAKITHVINMAVELDEYNYPKPGYRSTSSASETV